MNQTLARFILNMRHRLKKMGIPKKMWRKLIAEKYMKNAGNIRDVLARQGEDISTVFSVTWDELQRKKAL